MLLAFLDNPFAPGGGAVAELPRWVEEVNRAGHRCRLYLPQRGGGGGQEVAGAGLCRVQVSGHSRRRRHRSYVEQVREALARDPVDAVVGFAAMPGLDVLVATGACYVQGARGWWRRGAAFRHYADCERAVFAPAAATHILCLTDSQRDAYRQCYHTPAGRLHLLPPGVARELYPGDDAPGRRRALRQSLDVAEGEHVLLFVGSDFHRQGLDRALHALAHARDVQPHQAMRLLVAGGDRARKFHRLARKLGVRERVYFLGAGAALPELLLGADALVHPAREEVAGVQLLQALVAGLPVIATQTCGYAGHVAAARAGLVLRDPYRQEDLDDAVLRTIDGVYRGQCRETGLTYARLTDLYSLHARGVELIAQLCGRG